MELIHWYALQLGTWVLMHFDLVVFALLAMSVVHAWGVRTYVTRVARLSPPAPESSLNEFDLIEQIAEIEEKAMHRVCSAFEVSTDRNNRRLEQVINLVHEQFTETTATLKKAVDTCAKLSEMECDNVRKVVRMVTARKYECAECGNDEVSCQNCDHVVGS